MLHRELFDTADEWREKINSASDSDVLDYQDIDEEEYEYSRGLILRDASFSGNLVIGEE